MPTAVVCARCAWTGEPESADGECPCCGESLPRAVGGTSVSPATPEAKAGRSAFAYLASWLLVLAVAGLGGTGGLAIHLNAVADQRQSRISALEAERSSSADAIRSLKQTSELYEQRSALRVSSSYVQSLNNNGSPAGGIGWGSVVAFSTHYFISWSVTVDNLSETTYAGAFTVHLYRCVPNGSCDVTTQDETVQIPPGEQTIRRSLNVAAAPPGAYTLIVRNGDQILLVRPFVVN